MDDLAKQIAEKVVADTKYFTATIGFLGVFIGAIITITGNIILHILNSKKERRQEILKRELDRLYELEEMAGRVTEWVSNTQLDYSIKDFQDGLNNFVLAGGTLRKYPKLKQAINDLSDCVLIIVHSGKKDYSINSERKELECKYQVFITELKTVLKSIKT